jgi:flavodoxin I
MNKTLIVYDSMFGNTEKIAQAIGGALGTQVIHVDDIKPEHLVGLDVLIVGSPTQAFQPLKPIKAFLKDIPAGALKGVKVAAFDTRADVQEVGSRILTLFVKLFGYAAEPIAAQLIKKGGMQAIAPAGFFVTDKEGPLKEGELKRAAAWAQQVQP